MITFLGISVQLNGQVIQSLGYVTRCTESEYTCLALVVFVSFVRLSWFPVERSKSKSCNDVYDWMVLIILFTRFLVFFLLVTDFWSLSSTQTSSTGLKTRHFNNIITELSSSLRIHAACNSRLNGVSLEFTGEVNDEGYSVTECVGGSMELNEGQLGLRYQVGTCFCFCTFILAVIFC